MSKFPRVVVDLHKLDNNLSNMKKLCDEQGITMAGVVKGCGGILCVSESLEKAGVEFIASSRIAHLRRATENGVNVQTMLIRIPMLTECEDVVKHVDLSLNSDIAVLRKLNEEALKQNKIHQVILMDDIGDLREGFWEQEELVYVAEEVEFQLEGLELAGIGTNLGCYGAIATTKEKMEELIADAEAIETAIGRELKYISGGGSRAIPLIFEGTMPKRINHLRIGEGFLLARDMKDMWPEKYGKMYQDVFKLEMEVVEVFDKPTYPVGIIAKDGFDLTKEYVDRGIRRRMILAGGRVDYGYHEMLLPDSDKIELIGASSDHTIADCEEIRDSVKVGDIFGFELSYANMVFATCDQDMNIEIDKSK